MKKISFAIALFAVSLLAACNNTPALPTVAPTLAVTIAPTVAATVVATQAVPATVAPRRTLPPTFTPTSEASATPTATEILITETPFVPGAQLPPACATFDIDYTKSAMSFQVGTAPTVAWLAVEGAVRYHVELADVNGRTLKNDVYIAETSYSFDAKLFKGDSNLYTWSVYPINQAGDQMCFAIGGEMEPTLQDPNQ